MAAFLEDTFTGTAGTNIGSHNPDVGDVASWNSPNIQLNGSGKIIGTSASFHFARNTTTRPSEDYTVTVRGTTVGTASGDRVGALFRSQGTGANQFYIFWIIGTGSFEIVENFGPTFASGSVSGFSGSQQYDLVLTVSGSSPAAIDYAIYEVGNPTPVVSGSTTDTGGTGLTSGAPGITLRNTTSTIDYMSAEEYVASPPSGLSVPLSAVRQNTLLRM